MVGGPPVAVLGVEPPAVLIGRVDVQPQLADVGGQPVFGCPQQQAGHVCHPGIAWSDPHARSGPKRTAGYRLAYPERDDVRIG